MGAEAIISKPVPVAIIGGGAAGMFAAAACAERHIGALLVERKPRLGAKVLMTANGRCNFTKDISGEQFLADLGFGSALPRPGMVDFVAEAIRDCPPRAIIKWFQSLRVPLRRMADARMFPADGKAATIVHAFGDRLRDLAVPILTNCPVLAIARDERRGRGFLLETAAFTIAADNVLIATGGLSYPKTGSVGDGQNFARKLGHSLVGYRPGLIGLETTEPIVVRQKGRRFEDGRAWLLDASGRVVYEYRGEVDCETFGLSGAAIYNCQRFLEHYARAGREMGALTLEVWFERNRLKFGALKPRPLKESIVTIGGVATDEVDPRTMESKFVKGLYFAGEVLDIDGPTGGYNLTLAFATANKAISSIQKGTSCIAPHCRSGALKSTAQFSRKGKRR